jgi:predicted amidohydrolase YtcJ
MAAGRRDATLGAGDPADLVVLDGDPFTAERDGLRTMPIAATMLGGDWTHRTGI